MGHHIGRGPNGHLLKQLDDGHLTYARLGTCYEIDGYVDGDITACTDCDSSVEPIWDGKFDDPRTGVPYCVWRAPRGRRIDGTKLQSDQGGVRIKWYFDTDQSWDMQIMCEKDGGPGGPILWRGVKGASNTPSGVYVQNAGCDTISTLSIVECT